MLQLVQEAEDERAALTAGCAWLRRECGADAVAFLAPDGGVVASEGWRSADAAAVVVPQGAHQAPHVTPGKAWGAWVTAPVTYAGVRTGLVAARGPSDRHGTLGEGARTLAALCAPALRSRLDAVSGARRGQGLTPEILGRSPAIAALKDTIARAAVTPFAVLIEGDSGTGKELVARAIHRLSPRRDRRLCAAINDDLVEAELFGHARGAFTGAVSQRTGLFEEAHAGTLFLDEVSELSPRAQAKLLRVLQEREVRRVGENAPRAIDVRVIAATNRPLSDVVARGAFREDLLFRLAVVRVRLPPLRARVEDIPPLAEACWRSLTSETGKRVILGPDALASLCCHRWPGNVREFQNAMAALIVLAPVRGRVGARHVSQVLAESRDAGEDEILPLDRVRAQCERRAVFSALARHGGRRAPAARELGLTRQGLTKALRRLGLSGGDSAGVA